MSSEPARTNDRGRDLAPRDRNRRTPVTSQGPASGLGPEGPCACGCSSSPPLKSSAQEQGLEPLRKLWKTRAPIRGRSPHPRRPPGPVSFSGPRRPGMFGPAARTWLRLQGAGRPHTVAPEPSGTRSRLGSPALTPRAQPEPERPPYRAASALPARGKGATGFPGRTSRASGLARGPSARESGARRAAPPLSGRIRLSLCGDGRVRGE